MTARKPSIYREMYQNCELLDDNQKAWLDDRVKMARDIFEKHDRVVWFIRLAKFGLMQPAMPLASRSVTDLLGQRGRQGVSERRKRLAQDAKFLRKMIDRKAHLGMDGTSPVTEGDVEGIQVEMEHFLKMLALPQFDDIDFGWRSAHDIMAELVEIEDVWRGKNSGKSLPEEGIKIATYPDGSAWFDLQKSGCQREAESMGHCGNGEGSPSETLLSYRKPDLSNPGHWVPFLTFVLNKETGFLGEMKGRANDKPAPRYHSVIVDLLEQDRIRGIQGGGYMPESNFSIGDLDDGKQLGLAKKRPSLLNLKEVVDFNRRFPGTIDVDSAIMDRLSSGGATINKDRTAFRLNDEPFTLSELAKKFDLRVLDGYSDLNEVTYIPDSIPLDQAGNVAEDIIDRWLEDQGNEDRVKDLALFMEHIYGAKPSEKDIQSGRSIFRFVINQKHGYMHDVVDRAILEGVTHGFFNSVTEARESHLRNMFENEYACVLDNNDGDYDIWLTPRAIEDIVDNWQDVYSDLIQDGCTHFEAIKEAVEEECLLVARDLVEPHDGFEGWDESSAYSQFKSEMDEAITKYRKVVNWPKNVQPFGDKASERLPESIAIKVQVGDGFSP